MRLRIGRYSLLALLLCLAGTHTSLAAGADSGGFRSITTAPSSLSNGSPFLLEVRLTTGVSSVRGSWNGNDIAFFKKPGDVHGQAWMALLGVDVETAPGDYPLTIEAALPDGTVLREARQMAVAAARYRTGTLTVPENFVQPDEATQKEIAADKEFKDRAFAESAPEPLWRGDFAKPVHAASTDSFGTRRTFNGKLASIHRGMDFRAASGTPVAAANSGKVVLARKLFYEGNCVVIDHGQGFYTLYMHLSRIGVAEGAEVGKGERLGLSGATGRVTGPHLHFAVRWHGAYLDPAGLFGLNLAGEP